MALGPDSTPEAGRGNGHHSKHFDLMGTAKHDTAAFLDEDGDTSYTVSSGGGRLDARATSKIFDEAEMEYVGVYSEDAFAARFERVRFCYYFRRFRGDSSSGFCIAVDNSAEAFCGLGRDGTPGAYLCRGRSYREN